MPDLEFLHGRHLPRCTAVWIALPDYCSLQMMTGGGIDLRYDQQQYQLSGRHRSSCRTPARGFTSSGSAGQPYWVHRYVAFRGALMTRWQEAGLLPFMPQRVPARGDFVRRFDELLQLFARPDRLGHLRAVNLLEGLLLHLADSRRPEKALWLDRAKELVLQLPGFRPDYSWVADQLGMALSTFRRAFRREAGVSVHQFLLHSRIETAKYLLAETQAPIKSIARQLGYRDVFFFSRQFARLPRCHRPPTAAAHGHQADRPSEPPT